MKKYVFVLSLIFVILTIIGGGYVFLNKGRVNAGYSVIPMVFAIVFITWYRSMKSK